MKHTVKLSNDEWLVLDEREGSLSIGWNDSITGSDEYWIAQITRDGVLAYSNSGEAPESLTKGLTDKGWEDAFYTRPNEIEARLKAARRNRIVIDSTDDEEEELKWFWFIALDDPYAVPEIHRCKSFMDALMNSTDDCVDEDKVS